MRSRDHFGVFAFLLGAAVLFHQSKLDDWAIPSTGLAVTLGAVWLMLKPTSLPRFFGLLGLHAVTVPLDMPTVVNHWLLLFLAEVGLFVAVGVGRLQARRWTRDAGELYVALAPYLRIQVAIVYGVAALSKLNSDFLDPALSCAVELGGGLLDAGPMSLHAGWMDSFLIWGTIGIEIALPFLLLWRRTRVAAIFIGLAFHLALALAGHLAFSGFAMAYYWLFAPDDASERFERLLAARPRLATLVRGLAAFWSSRIGSILALGAALAGALAFEIGLGEWVSRGMLVLFVLASAGLAWILALCALADRTPVRFAPHPLRLASPVWLLGPLLVVANALSPYVGLKTQSTFTMYSNLQTEGAQWNHAILPESLKRFDLQDDLVTIVASNDPAMQRAAENDRRWVWAALRSWAQRHEDASITYEHDGKRYTAPRAGADERLAMGSVLTRLAFFRDVPPTPGNNCRVTRRAGSEQGS
ncbi:MAG: HTTM domain-containing protein [Acidimicrobiales bacterium]